MAHAATLSRLADDLIASVAGNRGETGDSRHLHERTLKGLKKTSHGRTNQFDVQSRLDGLVEKFAVLNRDDLADGLQGRLEQLPVKSKWLPEILSLLLELSDRPLEKTRIEDVEAASETGEGQSSLTWAEIVADDPLDEPGIWDDVERGYHSSDDDFTTDEGFSGDETQATSVVEEEDAVALAQMHVVQIDDAALSPIKAFRRALDGAANEEPISELTLLRETLSMLHGLPTSTYSMDRTTGRLNLAAKAKLVTASTGVIQHKLNAIAEIGSSLNAVRLWSKNEQQRPTLRSCQAATSVELVRLGHQLATLEQRYLTPQQGTISSLMDMRADVEHIVQPFLVLSRLLHADLSDTNNQSTAILNGLYDQACIAQLSGDHAALETLVNILGAGLDTYLRPVSRWIATGECDHANDFLVVERDADCDLGRMWHDRYALRRGNDNEAAASRFLQPFVATIFALGKGRAFLKALALDDRQSPCVPKAIPLRLTGKKHALLPLSQVLADALETRIAEQSRDQTPLLRRAILHDHRLLSTVDALQDIFASSNGRRFQTFADTLFWRVDHGARWKNAFLLTELAQSALGSADGVSAESIAVDVMDDRSEDPPTAAATSIASLQDVQLRYHVSWPLQNVTGSAFSASYSKAFTFLLQTYRAKYLLRQQVFPLRPFSQTQSAISPSVQKALRLHQRLMTVIDVLHAHATYTSAVLSAELKRNLERAEDLDAMASVWQSHEKELEVSLLVADKLGPVRDAISAVLGMSGYVVGIGEDVDRDAMQVDLESSLSFVVAGLKGISRVGGNTALEQLAERLEWAVQ